MLISVDDVNDVDNPTLVGNSMCKLLLIVKGISRRCPWERRRSRQQNSQHLDLLLTLNLKK
ncbi:hypothetical protein HAX54_011940, partial [Datura stramonium]|nr:hypothetical protein [Datura stramonium]